MLPISQTRKSSQALLGVALASTSMLAMAGPAVGTVIGTPSTATTTVQARVISSSPVVAQVATPREACYDELRSEPARSSGAGAILGAIAGAAVGNAVGKGSGRAVATGVGLIGGAVLGNHIENDGRPGSSKTVRRCEQQTVYENQVVAYSVVYEVGGQRYTTQMPNEPGNTIPVQLTVNPTVVAPSPAPVVYTAPPRSIPVAPVVYEPVVYQPAVYTSSVVSRPGLVLVISHGRHVNNHRHGHGHVVERHERRHWNRHHND